LARSLVMRPAFAANFYSVALVEFKLDYEAICCPAWTLNGATLAST
jgi:hypothetical protein